MDGLFVDDAPQGHAINGAKSAQPQEPANDRRRAPKSKRSSSRASERRKAEGFEQEGGVGAETALGARGADPAPSSVQNKLSYAAGVLTCIQGTEEGLALNLIEGTYTIGRGRDNNFVLKDIASSRSHIRIEVHDNAVSVTDLGSGNGSRVNGRRIRTATLNDGDRVEIGNTILRFEYHGNDRSRELNQPQDVIDAIAEQQRRQPTQDRIAEAAERLAAELSGRIRNEDDFDQLDTAQFASNPRADSPLGPPLKPTAKQQNGSLVEAIDEMVRDVSSPGASLKAAELWNETATHVPLSEVVPADDPRRPQRRGPMAAEPQPPQPSAHQQTFQPQPHVATAALPPPLPEMSAPIPADPQGGSSALLISVVVFLFIVFVGVGGFAAWYFVWPMLGDSAATSQPLTQQYASEITAAAMALTENNLDAAEKHAKRALELVPDDKRASDLLSRVQAMRVKKGDVKKNPKKVPLKKKAAGTSTTNSGTKSTAAKKTAPVQTAPKKAAPKKAAPKKAAPRKAAKKKAAPRKAAPRKATPKKAAPRKAAPKKSSGMTDAQAKKAMRSALRQKKDDSDAACVAFRKIAKTGPRDSIWTEKAKTWAARCR